MPDQRKNFAYSTVATVPSPATSGTSLVVATGDGVKFPIPPFNATVWPASTQPLTSNAEVVRVTAISTDTLTITRAQEGSTARSVGTGDQIAATLTALEMQWADQASGLLANFQTDLLNNGGIATSLSGTGTSANFATGVVAGHPGCYQLNSGTVVGNIAYLIVSSSASGQDVAAADNWECEFIFETPAVVTDNDIRFGWIAGTSLTGGCWLEKLAADTDFFLKVGVSSTFDTRQDSGQSVAASTWYHGIIGRLGSQVYFSVWPCSGTQPAQTFYTPTNMPNASMYPAIGIVAQSTTSRSLVPDFARLSVFGLSR